MPILSHAPFAWVFFKSQLYQPIAATLCFAQNASQIAERGKISARTVELNL
jgi:hypothetical protein